MTAPERQRGRLKVFLGYAAGVGKTFRMLTEAHELKAQGVDVVIGYFEPHARKDTMALSEGLEHFALNLSNATNAAIMHGSAMAMIGANDAASVSQPILSVAKDLVVSES